MRKSNIQRTHSRNQEISHLFQEREGRNVNRLKGSKAQQAYDVLFEKEEKAPLFPIKTKEFVDSLIAEHIEYARLEEEYTRTKIKNAIRNAANRKWAKGKLIMLEEDYDWDYYRTFQIIQNIFSQYIFSIILIPQRLHLEEPEEYKQAREDYLGWMDRITAGVNLEDGTKILSDSMDDNSPHPKKISNHNK